MSEYGHILLAVDFDEDAPGLIQRAEKRAQQEGALLSIVHVDQSVKSTLMEGVVDLDASHDQEESFFQEAVDNMTRLLMNCSSTIKHRLICSGEFGKEISFLVERYEIDLLIIGHHESGRLRQLFVTACDPVVRMMPCDLLLIKL